jgi:hypothetical protein
MRKALTILLLVWIGPALIAQRVSVETASRVAENFYSQCKRDLGMDPVPSKLDLVHIQSYKEMPAYFVFGPENNQGFVMVSGSYSFHPVVGFSPDGSFDRDQLPPALAEILKEYEFEVAETDRKKSINTRYLHLWEQYDVDSPMKSTAAEDAVISLGPLLRSKWAQGCHYNSLCPEDPQGPCGHALVGCVAVAIAQVMNYYGHPVAGSHIKSYNHDKYGLQSAEFETTPYQWQKMPDRLMDENDEVARLLYHCAVASEMNFGPSSSSAFTYKATSGMAEYFNYTDDFFYH